MQNFIKKHLLSAKLIIPLMFIAGISLFYSATSHRKNKHLEKITEHALGLPHPVDSRVDIVPWPLFLNVSLEKNQEGNFRPVFGKPMMQLDGKQVKLQGFVNVLEAGTAYKHFFLSKDSPTCPFCLADGPDQLVEIFSDDEVEPTQDAILISGTLHLVKENGKGIYYRLSNGKVED